MKGVRSRLLHLWQRWQLQRSSTQEGSEDYMDESVVAYKLLITYDVNMDDVQAYQQFVMGRYIPAMQSMGFHIHEAWHTAYGNAPNRLLEFVCEDKLTLDSFLENEAWEQLNDQLTKYVASLDYKLIPYRKGFQV